MSLRRLVHALLLTFPLALSACDAHEPTAMTSAVHADSVAAGSSDAKELSAVDGTQAPATARMVIRTAELRLRDDAPDEVIAAAIRLAEQVGGFVASSSTSGAGSEIHAVDASLRIPAEKFEQVLSQLREQGDLLSESVAGEDVTEQHADISARLRSQRALEDRLLAILAKVDSVKDALEVEGQLTAVRTEIERLEGRKRIMEDRVALATIKLSVSSPVRYNPAQAETVMSRLDRAVDDAGQLFVAILAGLIRLIGGLLPLGLVAAPLFILGRRALRRRRQQQAVMAQSMTVDPRSTTTDQSWTDHRL